MTEVREVRDDKGSFDGFDPRECGEHRTVGTYRAWCFQCGEWCYPSSPCRGCEEIPRREREEALVQWQADMQQWQADMLAFINLVAIAMTPEQSAMYQVLLEKAGVIPS